MFIYPLKINFGISSRPSLLAHVPIQDRNQGGEGEMARARSLPFIEYISIRKVANCSYFNSKAISSYHTYNGVAEK